MDNALMDGFPGVTFGLHLCRGNQGSRWLAEGSYDTLARTVFRRTHAQRLLLEYDDPRAGSFQPLADVPEGKMVILGLVTTKRARLEPVDEIVGRIHAATQFVPLDRLGISPQCGFASSIMGNDIDPFGQASKLKLVVEAATQVWEEP
jgi:5-methyltetrahydropteroyltriglutamate--homocysteine methyltransferase